jgi:hypothetical protein
MAIAAPVKGVGGGGADIDLQAMVSLINSSLQMLFPAGRQHAPSTGSSNASIILLVR